MNVSLVADAKNMWVVEERQGLKHTDAVIKVGQLVNILFIQIL